MTDTNWNSVGPPFVEATRNAVLLGRGKHAEQWEGNVFFRKAVDRRAEDYLLAYDSPGKRDEIANEVMAEIQANGSRFLQLQRLRSASDAPNLWVVISKAAARNKVKQALRDFIKPAVSRRAASALRRMWTPSGTQSLISCESMATFPGGVAESSESIQAPIPLYKAMELAPQVMGAKKHSDGNASASTQDATRFYLGSPAEQKRLLGQEERLCSPRLMTRHGEMSMLTQTVDFISQASNLTSGFQHNDPKQAPSITEGFHDWSLGDPRQLKADASRVVNASSTDDISYREQHLLRNTAAAASSHVNLPTPLDEQVGGLLGYSQVSQSIQLPRPVDGQAISCYEQDHEECRKSNPANSHILQTFDTAKISHCVAEQGNTHCNPTVRAKRVSSVVSSWTGKIPCA